MSIDRWGVFENYFRDVIYFQTRHKVAYSKVKIHELEAIN